MYRTFALFVCMAALLDSPAARSAEPVTAEQAAAAMEKAVAFFRGEVAVEGTYLWRYSEDLRLREGENAATKTMAWVQPPGTPSVGEAYLAAYQRTGQKHLLEAAAETARGLVQGQLHSGGWDYRIEFDPAQRSRAAYRVDGEPQPRARNVSTLDDDTTQAAVRFLMHADRALDFQDEAIHEAVLYALQSLLAVQYPNGAWPQRFSGPPKADDFPVVKASFPDEWPRAWPNEKYIDYYTLNDNTLADTMATLFEAGEIYGEPRYTAAAKRGGDFLILAQMPDPQPAWAQQYNAQMHPAWARKFEPPAITGGESQGAIRVLLEAYRQTGDKKYLEPVPRALDYFKKSELPGGRLARFYELKTNRPLYFTRQYELVYTADDLPTHYSFVVNSNIDRLRRDYDRLLATDPDRLRPVPRPPRYELTDSLTAAARQAIDSLDSRGAWVEDGRLRAADTDSTVRRIISTQTFIRNLDTLSRVVAAAEAGN
jgi:hypothetical protein